MGGNSMTLDVDDGIGLITLSRTAWANAIDMSAARSLRAAAASALARPDLAAVVLSADGDVFSAGIDLLACACAASPQAYTAALSRVVEEAVARLRALQPPLICAVQGPCLGAALNIARAADVVVADRGSLFCAEPTLPGWRPDCDAPTWASEAAADLGLPHWSGPAIDADEEQGLGAVTHVTPPGTARACALALAFASRSGTTSHIGAARFRTGMAGHDPSGCRSGAAVT